jgi:Zn-dependent alcohol dehydrogenase
VERNLLRKFADYLQGKVKIDEYVTHHRKFAEINDGFHDMHVSCLSQSPFLNS